MTQEQAATAAASNTTQETAAAPKPSLMDEIKQKLFPKARGRDKPAEKVKEENEAKAKKAAAEGEAEKKPGLLDRIKGIFGGGKKDKEQDAAAAADKGKEQAGEAKQEQVKDQVKEQKEEVKEEVKEATPAEPVKDLAADERPVSVFIQKGEEAASAAVDEVEEMVKE